MAGVVLHFFLLLAAAGALWAMWRYVAHKDRVFGVIAGLGLLGRSVLGLVLFWVSWLDLIPRGNHRGDGIWFFAADGEGYMLAASKAAGEGFRGILTRPRGLSAEAYLDLLAGFALLFGEVASIGLLLNLFCYLGICMIIARCGSFSPAGRTPAIFAIAAISFYPAGVLWSLQPLKDTLLHFFIVALFGVAMLWLRSWQAPVRPGWSVLGFLGIAVSVYETAGTRWYFGLAVVGACGVFLFLTVATVRQRRLILTPTSTILFILLTRLFLAGSGKLVPPPLRLALSRPIERAPATVVVEKVPVAAPAPAPVSASGAKVPPQDRSPIVGSEQGPKDPGTNVGNLASSLVTYTEEVRGNFARSGGGTEIKLSDSSIAVRWVAGLISIVVPHFIIEHLDFMHIGGGRGLFWFADADTIAFDIVVAGALLLILRRWKQVSLSNPLLWLVVLTAVFVAVPLLYAITNFGTLLRFRGMLYVPMAIAPLAAVIGSPAPPGDDQERG